MPRGRVDALGAGSAGARGDVVLTAGNDRAVVAPICLRALPTLVPFPDARGPQEACLPACAPSLIGSRFEELEVDWAD